MNGLSEAWLTLSMSELQSCSLICVYHHGWHWEGTCTLGKAMATTKTLAFLEILKP